MSKRGRRANCCLALEWKNLPYDPYEDYRLSFLAPYFLKFPSCTPLRPVTQRKVAGWMSQYFTGLANRLMPVYRFFFPLVGMGQKSLTPTLLILLPWR
ncbi:hypothetical protein EYF80_029059 [Liparis tanakae]|uniref:Uncharacterized protein n=1 Tax=Liparis tanakae TaxID=230148 RepID=A0A4Z2H650_9TELE|nr:hypothetical protein EYF80_029059 [Liparis tanakae]